MASCLTNVTGITAWHYSITVGYIGETTQHMSTRIEEHLRTDKKAHVFTHLVIMKLERHLVLKIVLK